jgi:MFS family permease
LRACEEGVLLYPMYPLLFADAGLGTVEISTLFAIWSITGFLFEVPSGAWADAFSRRRLLALAGLLRAAGFTLWLVWPSYEAFAAGFALWGISGAMQSGTTEALLYDELAVLGAADRYASVLGRGETAALLSIVVAMALAAPAYAIGGYALVGAASVAVSLASAAVALSFPETPRVRESDGNMRHYLRTLGAGLAEVRGDRRVSRAAVLAAALAGLVTFEEYLPTLARDAGAPTVAVPLLVVLPVLAAAAASAAAGRWTAASPARIGAATAAAALLLGGGALVPHPAGMVPVAAAFGLLQVGLVLADTRLQESIAGRARATVTSVASLGAEVFALAVFAAFALGSGMGLGVPALVALCAVPLLALATLVRRWLPPHREPPHRSAADRQPPERQPPDGAGVDSVRP